MSYLEIFQALSDNGFSMIVAWWLMTRMEKRMDKMIIILQALENGRTTKNEPV